MRSSLVLPACLNVIKSCAEDFLRYCDHVKYTDSSITNIEAWYWWSLISYYRPEIILESGVCRGRSTEILGIAAKHFGCDHVACDPQVKWIEGTKKRFKGKGLPTRLIALPSDRGWASVLSNDGMKRSVVIIDGPKGGTAFKNAIRTASSMSDCVALGCHDCKEGHSPRLALVSAHKRYLVDKLRLFFTVPEWHVDMEFLNAPIREEIMETVGEWYRRGECHYVGLCLS